MTEKEKQEKSEELENLKLLLRFHGEKRIINENDEFWKHIDDILDEISRLEKELNED